jgi:hypothetical protein
VNWGGSKFNAKSGSVLNANQQLSIIDNLPSKKHPKQPAIHALEQAYQMTPWVAVLVFLFFGMMLGGFLLTVFWLATVTAFMIFIILSWADKTKRFQILRLSRWLAFSYSAGFFVGELIIKIVAVPQIH